MLLKWTRTPVWVRPGPGPCRPSQTGLRPVCKGRNHSLHAPIPDVSHGCGFQGTLSFNAGNDLDLSKKQRFAGMRRIEFALAETGDQGLFRLTKVLLSAYSGGRRARLRECFHPGRARLFLAESSRLWPCGFRAAIHFAIATSQGRCPWHRRYFQNLPPPLHRGTAVHGPAVV